MIPRADRTKILVVNRVHAVPLTGEDASALVGPEPAIAATVAALHSKQPKT